MTVYGYGAPVTDVEAIELMENAYSLSKIKDIAPFTVINLSQNEKEQKERWADFYDAKMIMYCNSLKETMLWDNPRVSLETLFDAILQQQPRTVTKSFEEFKTLEELQSFIKTITEFDMAI